MLETRTIKLKYQKILAVCGIPLMMLLLSARVSYAKETTYALNMTKLQLIQGQSQKLKISHVKSSQVKWKSTDETVASVNSKGIVTAHTKGQCKIKASYNGKKYSCTVKVKKIKLSSKKLVMVRFRRSMLKLSAEDVQATWKSSDMHVATVTQDGVVTAENPGTCIITSETDDATLKCAVTVLPINIGNLQATYPYQQKTAKGKVSAKTIVLAGSSSMDYWREAIEVFSEYRVVNTAIAGSTVVQWKQWYKSLITRYKPDAVVLYVGSNDLGNGGFPGSTNAKNTISLLKKIRKSLKKVPIFYVSVTPCWYREGAWDEIEVSNRLVEQFCEGQKNMYYIDLASSFMTADGTPNRALFWDQLHPNAAGYVKWEKKVGKTVKRILKKSARK